MRDSDIANVFEVSEATLKKYCAEELSKGRSIAKAEVQNTAFKLATSGKCPAMTMFWLKTRDQWYETKKFINESHSDDQNTPDNTGINLKNLSKEERAKLKELLKKANAS